MSASPPRPIVSAPADANSSVRIFLIAAGVKRWIGPDNDSTRAVMEAYAAGRETIWSKSAEKYLDIFGRAAARKETAPRLGVQTAPRPDLSAVRRMTDDCGIFQHAKYRTPDRAHGYCVDDNARALILVQRLRALGNSGPDLERLESTYAAFVNHAWNEESGRFRNFMSYGREWSEAAGSEDSNGRTFWSLGEAAAGGGGTDLNAWALDLAQRVAPHLRKMTSLRTRAFMILGAGSLRDAAPSTPVFAEILAECADALMEAFNRESRPDWRWFERVLGYDNACLPHALLAAGRRLRDEALVTAGVESLEWLTAAQTSRHGRFQPVGNESFGEHYGTARIYDQQPLEVASTINACSAAYAATGDKRWKSEARRAFNWFFGENEQFAVFADKDGGCFDGLGRTGVNRNQGAESILSLQLAHCELALQDIRATTS